MESNIVKLKNEFNDIINVRSSVKNIFDILQTRIDKLKLFYAEFIKNDSNGLFVFGLDSFHFQSKLIDIEYDDMKRLFLAINNRMYCEYFKLNKIILEYILTNINDKKNVDIVKTNNYPIYKDLEPFKEYKFETIQEIHENILNLLSIIISVFTHKENELLLHKKKQSIGLNIDNYINTFCYNNNVIREKINMFIAYIEFFHKMHIKYLKRFNNKIQLMYTHISNDIKFDDSIEMNANKKKESNEDMNSPIDKPLLNLPIEIDTADPENPQLNSYVSSLSLDDSDSNGSVNSISERFKGSSLGKLITNSPSKKSGLKSALKRNVSKITNMLGLSKPTENEIPDKIVVDKDLDNFFTEVNRQIIIDEPPVTKFDVDKKENIAFLEVIKEEVKEVIKEEIKEVIKEEVKEVIKEEVKEVIKEEAKEEPADELKEESVTETLDESVEEVKEENGNQVKWQSKKRGKKKK
jgi:hypothetical protein